MIMSLLGFTLFVVIFGVVTSNYDVNLQAPYKEMTRKRSVEATTVIPPDPRVEDEGTRILLTRLENLCMERMEYLITDTNSRFLSLENQSSVFHSTLNNIGDKLDRIDDLEVINNLLVKKLNNLTVEVGQMSQCCENSEIVETKVENLDKSLQELMDVTRNLTSDVQAIKRNDSPLINGTRLLVDLPSNPELKQISNKGLQELQDLQTSTSTTGPPNLTVDKQYPRNCREVQQSGKSASGTYMLQPEHAPTPFQAVCDLETRGGGWTVIQRRFDGSQEFFRGWEDYKNGFGNLEGELWLGLEKMYLLTGFAVNELLIEMSDFELRSKSAFYSEFSLGSEVEGYSIKVLGAYSGDAGNSFPNTIGTKFTTYDYDQDDEPEWNYAAFYDGAWWYLYDVHSSLNGKFQIPMEGFVYTNNIFWHTFNNGYSNLKHTRMLVRPKV